MIHILASDYTTTALIDVGRSIAAFNQKKALVGAVSVITNLWMELFQALSLTPSIVSVG